MLAISDATHRTSSVSSCQELLTDEELRSFDDIPDNFFPNFSNSASKTNWLYLLNYFQKYLLELVLMKALCFYRDQYKENVIYW